MLSFLPKFSALILAGMFAGFAYSAPVEVHIGIYAPFSDEKAFVGRNILGAMELAQEQTPAQEITYTFYTLNKTSETPVTANTLQKFIQVHHLDVLITEGADSGILAAPVAKQKGILHFSLSNEPAIADGHNNYLAWNAAHAHAAVLTKEVQPEFIAQYLAMHQSHPVTEAGHAYDVFQIIHKSTVMAMKSNTDFSKSGAFGHVPVLAAGTGLMGALNVDKNGLVYAQTEKNKSVG